TSDQQNPDQQPEVDQQRRTGRVAQRTRSIRHLAVQLVPQLRQTCQRPAGSLVPAGGRNVSRQRLRRRAPKYIGTHLVALLDIGTGHCRRVPLTLRRRREGPELLVGGFRLAFHLPQGVCPLLGQLPRSQRGGEYPSGRRILFGESVQRSHGELRAGQFAVLRFR